MSYCHKKALLEIAVPVRLVLETMSKQHNISVLYQQRSLMLLYLSEYRNIKFISEEYKLSYKGLLRLKERWAIYESPLAIICNNTTSGTDTVRALREKIEELLSDEPRSGCPATISAEQYCQIMAISLSPPSDYGRPITHWSRRELVEECIKQGVVPTISASQVGRFFKRSRPQTT